MVSFSSMYSYHLYEYVLIRRDHNTNSRYQIVEHSQQDIMFPDPVTSLDQKSLSNQWVMTDYGKWEHI